MSPLLYILTLTAVLVIIIYITLTLLDSPEHSQHIWPDQSFKFETGQELFNYTPSSQDSSDIIEIQPRRGGRILVTWKISPRRQEGPEKLVLRIYDSSRPESYYDVEANHWQGRLSFVSKAGVAYYVAAGLKSHQEFTPLVLSSPVIGRGKTLLH